MFRLKCSPKFFLFNLDLNFLFGFEKKFEAYIALAAILWNPKLTLTLMFSSVIPYYHSEGLCLINYMTPHPGLFLSCVMVPLIPRPDISHYLCDFLYHLGKTVHEWNLNSITSFIPFLYKKFFSINAWETFRAESKPCLYCKTHCIYIGVFVM